jgi:hypothetical protein
MTTITLQFNEKKAGSKELFNAMMKTGFFKKVTTKTPDYDPEFVKMIKKSAKGPTKKWTPALQKQLLGL